MKWDNLKRLQVEMLEGEEVSAEEYNEMLEIVPPVALVANAYLNGEPFDHTDKGARYALYYQKGDKYYYGGLATTWEFCLWLIPCEVALMR